MSHNAHLTCRTRIKVCGLTRESDVDAAVAAGIDAVGFVLYHNSPRCVTLARAAELARRLPPFVTPVLLFVNHSTDEVAAACATVQGAVAQFHGDETAAHCEQACALGRNAWLRAAHVPMDDNDTDFDLAGFVAEYAQAQAILLDTRVDGYGYGGSGRAFNWSVIPPRVDAHLVLSGGLNAANVTQAIGQVRPRCKTLSVDVSSGVEISGQKGIKSPRKISQFVAAVRAADHQLSSLDHHV